MFFSVILLFYQCEIKDKLSRITSCLSLDLSISCDMIVLIDEPDGTNYCQLVLETHGLC